MRGFCVLLLLNLILLSYEACVEDKEVKDRFGRKCNNNVCTWGRTLMNKSRIFCTDATQDDLSNFELLDPSSNYWRSLTITNSTIEFLNLTNFHFINTFILQNVTLTQLADSLDNFSSLQELHIFNSSIKDIKNVHFEKLTNMKVFNLSSVNLTEENPEMLREMSNLDEIHFTKNSLSSFKFEGPPKKLRILHVSENDLSSLGVVFRNYTTETFNISFNQLEKLNFDQLPNGVRNLLCSNNKIAALENVQSPTLSILDLQSNKLRELNPDTFKNLKKLDILNLRDNLLKVLPSAIFVPLNSLRFLDLSQNQIEELPYGIFGVDRLEAMNISHNKLKKINHALHSISQATILDFSDNSIDEFDVSILQTRRLRVISFKGNNFTCNNLINIVNNLKMRYVFLKIVKGEVFDKDNVEGIECKVPNPEEALLKGLKDAGFLNSTEFINLMRQSLNETGERVFWEINKKLENLINDSSLKMGTRVDKLVNQEADLGERIGKTNYYGMLVVLIVLAVLIICIQLFVCVMNFTRLRNGDFSVDRLQLL